MLGDRFSVDMVYTEQVLAAASLSGHLLPTDVQNCYYLATVTVLVLCCEVLFLAAFDNTSLLYNATKKLSPTETCIFS